MKTFLNPYIEKAATAFFGVDIYADIFEKLAMDSEASAILRRIVRRRIADDLRRSPILFIHIPKTGGTSIKRALYESDPGHATIRYYETFLPDHLQASTTLAVLRDPTERFLSAFDFLQNGGGHHVRIQPAPLRRLAHVRSIDHFIGYLENIAGDWLRVDTFARPQWWYIADRAGRVRVNHVALLEDQGEALAAFLRFHGARDIPHMNRTRRTELSLTAGQRQRLERLYQVDFRLYELVKRAEGRPDVLDGIDVSTFGANPASLRSTSDSIASYPIPSA